MLGVAVLKSKPALPVPVLPPLFHVAVAVLVPAAGLGDELYVQTYGKST
jgi:hypothetical protein